MLNEILFCTAFDGNRRIASGPLAEVALAVKSAVENNASVLTFDDATARVIDLDLRGSPAEVLARLAPSPVTPAMAPQRGRPKLGVVAREVTLLPRHWEWLNAQPGGASVALRKLVEAARRSSGGEDRARAQTEAAYRFMQALAGNLPGYEEALRALFAHDRARFKAQIAKWPPDVRDYAVRLAFE